MFKNNVAPTTHPHTHPPLSARHITIGALSKYLLYCHAIVSVRLLILVRCRRLEQIETHMNVQVDEETLLLFTSKTDKACLRDLFDSHCFTGEAEKQVHDFCFT